MNVRFREIMLDHFCGMVVCRNKDVDVVVQRCPVLLDMTDREGKYLIHPDSTLLMRGGKVLLHPSGWINMKTSIIWVNYNISLTCIKAIWGWFPLLTIIYPESSSSSSSMLRNSEKEKNFWNIFDIQICSLQHFKTTNKSLLVSNNVILISSAWTLKQNPSKFVFTP